MDQGGGTPHPDLTGMAWIPGGAFRMGSDSHYREEAPAHRVAVDGFWMDRAPVTNAAFAAFVAATGYRTVAEFLPDPGDYPDADPAALVAGSVVFTPAAMRGWGDWWSFVSGACWRTPDGQSAVAADHPVVQVAYQDAATYAAWAGKNLPTEAEWERAALGGLEGTEFAWGDQLTPDGIHQANIWQGRFPVENLALDGFTGLSPVATYPANPYGLVDMIGNVWEWTTDWWTTRHEADPAKPCCIPRNPRRGDPTASIDPRQAARLPRKVIKGGSHLCAPNYCQRYRPAARQPQAVDSATTHIGFRCIRR